MNVDALVALYASGKYESIAKISGDLSAGERSHERAFRVAGLSLVRLGRYAEARQHIETAMAMCPRTSTVRSWLPKDVLQSFQAHAPEFAWTTYQLAAVALENRDVAAVTSLGWALVDDEAVPGEIRSAAVELICEACRRQLSREAAAAGIERTLDRAATSVRAPAAALFRGLVAYGKGDIADAEAAFATVGADVATGLCDRIPAAQGAATFRARLRDPSAAHQRYFDARAQQAMVRLVDIGTDDRFVILCAADGHDVALHAQTLIASALHRCGDTVVHVHTINPTPASAAALDGIRHQVPWARISSSVEAVNIGMPQPYGAMARFLVAPLVLGAYKLPVVPIQIDTVVAGSPRAALRQLAGVDLAINTNLQDRLEYPWTAFGAAPAYFTPFAAAFEHLAEMGKCFWDSDGLSGGQSWRWIDRNALAYATDVMRGRRARIGELGRNGIDRMTEAALPGERKQDFIGRMSARYPLADLRNRRAPT
ncbi:hypothetical protein FHP25_36935 [Vineibacter terrae]|uniref:Uncharacterized protein n=1 Tax=Vineibacter terrae TaxID=2586908 RepID=A0A5C8PA64_9HYPH|nr:hypothetical protein [Vineibacter terrae]TXL69899.1 hypothetical protein FHP25_36935 [Vineibacter terrae]